MTCCQIRARESAAQKARRYAAEGRLSLVEVGPGRVKGTCKGGGAIYRLAFLAGQWHCSCPAKSEPCAHVRAAQLVVNITPGEAG